MNRTLRSYLERLVASEARSMRLQATGSCSIPMKRLPARIAATPVVPLPMNGLRIDSALIESQKYRTWESGRGQGTGLSPV